VNLAANFNGLAGTSAYDLAPAGSGSKVTWSFGYETGSSPLKRWKALMLDGFIGAEYNAGLQKLKARVEEDRRPTSQPLVVPQAPAPQGEQPAAGATGETVVPESTQGAPAQAHGGEAAPRAAAPPPAPQRR
jgi:hypothetical protein